MDLLGYVTDAILTVKRGTYIAIKKYPFIFEINMASKKYMTMDYYILKYLYMYNVHGKCV